MSVSRYAQQSNLLITTKVAMRQVPVSQRGLAVRFPRVHAISCHANPPSCPCIPVSQLPLRVAA